MHLPIPCKVHVTYISFLLPPNSLTLIEPGPVLTEFEKKVFEDGMNMDLSATDEETADMFVNIYLKNYKQIFETLGQTAEDIAEVICQAEGMVVWVCCTTALFFLLLARNDSEPPTVAVPKLLLVSPSCVQQEPSTDIGVSAKECFYG